MTKVLIVGAASAIAEATARCFAQRGASLCLVGRSGLRLEAIAADLRLRGATAVSTQVMDACDHADHAPMIAAARAALGGLDMVLVAYGTLPDQAQCEQDAAAAVACFDTNASSVLALCTRLANALAEEAPGGCLAVISSVAGDRGRASNYVYGAAKAAVTALCSGLRQRLQPAGVRVLTIKPGFIDTPMTAGFERKGPLWAPPDAAGRAIHAAMLRRNGEIYVPWFWRWIMLVIRSIPEAVFVRMRGL